MSLVNVTFFMVIDNFYFSMFFRKIIHRDLKSRNIFLKNHDNNSQKWSDLKEGDFGISRTLYTSSEKATTMIGTPFYLSPELLQELPYDQKADSWALGCLLFEICSLVYPFNTRGSFGDLMKLIVHGEPNYLDFPDTLCMFQPICKSLLRKSPKNRLSAEDVLRHPLLAIHLNSHSDHHQFCRSNIENLPKTADEKINENFKDNTPDLVQDNTIANLYYDSDKDSLSDTLIS